MYAIRSYYELRKEGIRIEEGVRLAVEGFAAKLVRERIGFLLEYVFEETFFVHAQHREFLNTAIGKFPHDKRMRRQGHESPYGDIV